MPRLDVPIPEECYADLRRIGREKGIETLADIVRDALWRYRVCHAAERAAVGVEPATVE